MNILSRLQAGLAGLFGSETLSREHQVAALCYRWAGDSIEILLITSRGRGNWILPKGWPEKGITDHDMAAQEAYEEAGVRGQIDPISIGFFDYDKTRKKSENLDCRADVYALEVDTFLEDFPEADDRERAWYSHAEAVAVVTFPQLKRLIRDFEPMRP